MRLSDCEKSILDGKEGRLQQVCLENIVRYAGILGAEELCPVSRATVFCGAHRYLEACGSEDFDEVFSRMNLAVDEVIAFERTCTGCAVQSDVAPCERRAFRPFGQSRAFFQKNRRFLERARRAGVTIAGTCAPYLTGWLPVRGEHFVTTESGVTVMGNSLWGAMGNSDGIEAAFWSAVCGRTPKWGLHLEANRAGTHLVRVEAAIDSLVEWDLLGKAIGAQLPPGAIPVIAGEFSGLSFQKLRQLCTTLAVSSSCEMCHLAGYTPEARSVQDAFRGARAKGHESEDPLQSSPECFPCSINQALMWVRLLRSSTLAPLRSASYIMNCRSLEGSARSSINSFRPLELKSLANPSPYLPFSSERMDFRKASL